MQLSIYYANQEKHLITSILIKIMIILNFTHNVNSIKLIIKRYKTKLKNKTVNIKRKYVLISKICFPLDFICVEAKYKS